ncbi:MAG: hypothetical protein WA579_02495, partial [Rhodomicrobium sp.]
QTCLASPTLDEFCGGSKAGLAFLTAGPGWNGSSWIQKLQFATRLVEMVQLTLRRSENFFAKAMSKPQN